MSNRDKRETVADIVAWLRQKAADAIACDMIPYSDRLEVFADRLEAAYKREHHCEKRYDRDGDEMPPHCAFDDLKIDRLQAKVDDLKAELERIRTSNAVALREALHALREAARNFYHEILNSPYNGILDKYTCEKQGFPSVLDLKYAIPAANIALSAPARNCDATKDEAEDAYKREFGRPWTNEEDELADWLFAEAKKEDTP